ncbi:hypothetical protein, partial [Pseudoalteromonas sp. SIMBA_162]|uniref:hypothetical protein n=1 Tax=Pseudoalteromonas sp. SIMBA_162 TaxID=3080867 RepID=UPI003978B178
MKTWNQLFIRQGWLLQEGRVNTFNCMHETKSNMEFLLACLDKAQVEYVYNEHIQALQMKSPVLTEEEWLT